MGSAAALDCHKESCVTIILDSGGDLSARLDLFSPVRHILLLHKSERRQFRFDLTTVKCKSLRSFFVGMMCAVGGDENSDLAISSV